MKVTVIGGGSSYTPELINGFLERISSFPLTELWLMDIAPQRLEVVGGFAQRMVQAKGAPLAIYLTTDQREAVRGARYVITQLRVGGMQARREDEYLGRRHGLIGQETTGVGGMAKALRTIPLILNLARDIRELAPNALLVNFTNPERARLDTLGLNHLTWHRGFTVDGKDLWPLLLKGYLADLRDAPHPEWDPRLIESLRMIPNYYLQYYYHTDRKLAEQERWPPSRAEVVMEIEARLLGQYAEPERAEPPQDLMERGGAYYSTLATQLLDAHYNDQGQIHVVNVPHGGAVPGWPQDWVLELPCQVDAAGVHPLPAEPLPPACFGLLAQVKMYEILTAEAAVHGSRNAAYQALLAHPLGPPADRISDVLDDMLDTSRAYLQQFWPDSSGDAG